MRLVQSRFVMVLSTCGGSGYRISNDLVLTAAHIVGESGKVMLPGEESWLVFQRMWHHEELDVAVLKVENTDELPSVSPAQWGLLSSGSPCLPVEAHGFPNFQAMGDGAPREHEQIDGHVNPMTGARQQQLHISVDSELWRNSQDPWPGMSGGPVLCHGMLIGVTTTAVGESKRLAATPISEFIFDEDFRKIVWGNGFGDPVVAPADLDALSRSARPRIWRQPRSLSAMLRPTAGVVPYLRQGDSFNNLHAWALRPGFGVCLLHGDAGVGKSRLAYELVHTLAREGWAATFVDEFDVVNHEVRDCLHRLKRLRRPTLLVVDYAETKPDVLCTLAECLMCNEDNLPVKLLLLARSAGTWWQLARRQSSTLEDSLHEAEVHELDRLLPEECVQLFRDAVDGFARCMQEMPGFAGAGCDWEIAAEVADATAQPNIGDDSPLSCQVTALAALLAANGISDDRPTQSAWEQLLAHDQRYWQRSAEHVLGKVQRGFVDDLIALVSLFGAHNVPDAESLLMRYFDELAPEKLEVIINLVVDILGSPPNMFLQPLRPSLLAERFAVSRIRERPTLISKVLPYVRDYQLLHALTLLGRAVPTDRDIWDRVGEVAAKHRRRMPFELLAGAAVAVPDARGIAIATQAAHHDLRPDQCAVLLAFAGEITTEQARQELWSLYTQAYSNLPEVQLRRAASRAATITDLLGSIQPDLMQGVVAGMEFLPLVYRNLSTLYDAFVEGGDIRAAAAGRSEHFYYESAMEATRTARSAAENAAAVLGDFAGYRSSFDLAPAVFDELGAALRELTLEVTDIRHRLDSLAEDFGENSPS